jgi:Protein of unknown function (DUF2946)
VLKQFRFRAALIAALALITLQSLMPLAGEMLVRNGVISSDSMQVVCSQAGVKFVSTADLNDSSTQHSVKCPWCQLGEPAVLPSVGFNPFFKQQHVQAWLTPQAAALPPAAWLLAPARAPPKVHAHFA